MAAWRFWITIVLALTTLACAGRSERSQQRRADRADEPRAAAAAPSRLVFLRAASIGGTIAASVFDVSEPGAPKFIGIINRGNKLSYGVTPGLYTFMVLGEAADFMQATVIGGKTYYVLVTPRLGNDKARFSFRPVRAEELDGSQFTSWERSTKLVTNTPKTLAWAKESAAEIADKRERYWPEWSGKSQSERNALTLRAEDGR